jgi:phytoene dehydrogenase-like protein
MTAHRYDAVVVGAALGGLASGAILASRGYRVAVVEALAQPGGRIGAVERRGYWIGWGHRDGHGIGDLAFFPNHVEVAAKEAGAELRLRPFVNRSVRVHWLPEGRCAELPADMLLAERADPLEQARALCRFFAGVEESEVDAVARGVLDAQQRLLSIDDERAWQLVPATVGDWLRRNSVHPAVRRVLLQQMECVPFTPSADTSLGRYVLHLKSLRGVPYIPDDAEAGGMQGLIAPWVRALERNGGELWLGWKPLEIVVEAGEVRGVVAADEASLIQVFEAPIAITDYPGWRLPELVDPALIPPAWLAAAERTRAYSADAVSWWAGLSRLPVRRSDGRAEDGSSPWQRILYGHDAVRRFYGGFYFPSLFSRRAAPPAKHLLGVEIVGSGESGRAWRRWSDARAALDVNLRYLREYYRDLDECVEWSGYQYTAPPQYLSWYAKPTYRHPVKVATIDGLYVAASTAEGTGSWVDIEAEAALEAVRLATSERGHLRKPPSGAQRGEAERSIGPRRADPQRS